MKGCPSPDDPQSDHARREVRRDLGRQVGHVDAAPFVSGSAVFPPGAIPRHPLAKGLQARQRPVFFSQSGQFRLARPAAEVAAEADNDEGIIDQPHALTLRSCFVLIRT